ncbi:hypothetical protein MIMGU_mgv1a017892mg [Erythranthe guttata]|uniref:DC1 domain-containing protein n=1 Tax=Erythranthe guttata TaxID=4155 RepID=A0A022QEM3_ERYGU|nr:hypothetical protein MIMGU_mgv1a017892mg [Erythranthe guttata]
MDEFKQSHFSHPHPLKLVDHQQTLNLITSPCSACKLEPSGTIYSCTICKDFFLHKKCFEMPTKLIHPFHKKHALTLTSKPTYGEMLFRCDACQQRGDGFSYHCKPCGFDLHVLCATLPFSITHESHAIHKLELITCELSKSKFNCSICMKLGLRQWLYRCKSCGFDAHLKCVGPTGDDSSKMIVNRSNGIAQAVQQMIVNNSDAIAQGILASGSGNIGGRGFGGGSSGEKRALQLLIELICILTNSGTSGAGGQDSVNNTGGGGGGRTDSVRSLPGNGNAWY